jgi:hypothetical protein
MNDNAPVGDVEDFDPITAETADGAAFCSFQTSVTAAKTDYGKTVALSFNLGSPGAFEGGPTFVFLPQNAREVAFALLQIADDIEGKGSPSGAAN